jgi:hypothetical protein
MKNLKMIENLKSKGLKFVDGEEFEYDIYILKLDEEENVLLDDIDEEVFGRNLGKINVIEFIEKGIEEGIFEYDEDEDIIYFDMDSDYIKDYFDNFLNRN